MAKIVIVDNNPKIVDLLVEVLAMDYQVWGFDESPCAKEFISENTIDMIITDIRMPKLNGIELLKYAFKTQPDITAIIMTAYHDIFATEYAAVYPDVFYLNKPTSIKELQILVKHALEVKKTMTDLSEEEELRRYWKRQIFLDKIEINTQILDYEMNKRDTIDKKELRTQIKSQGLEQMISEES